MHRVDNSKYMLYIEPSIEHKSEFPLEDELTIKIEIILKKAVTGISNYMNINCNGFFDKRIVDYNVLDSMPHITDCGIESLNYDYLLDNGMITNSLAPFYLKWYRNYIPDIEMEKIKRTIEFYNKTKK